MGLFSITRKKIAVVATVAVLGLGGGIVYAYWSSTGSGTGSASTASATSNLTISDTTSIIDMAPGVAAESISGTVANANSTGGANQYVHTVTVSIASVTEHSPGSGFSGTCSASDYTLSNAVMTVNQDLAPGQSVPFSGASIGFHDNPSVAQDNCQGATVNLSYLSN